MDRAFLACQERVCCLALLKRDEDETGKLSIRRTKDILNTPLVNGCVLRHCQHPSFSSSAVTAPMEDIDSSPPADSPNSRKRSAPDESPAKRLLNLKGTQFVMPTPPDTDHSSNVSISANNEDDSRHGSPAPSSSALSSVEVVEEDVHADFTNAVAPTTQAEASSNKSGQPPAKRRKLTPTEKQQKQQEKEAKAAEKAELKAQKEEEKRTKEEEKRKKAEKRDEKKRIKDEEKRKITEEREAKKREKELEEERKAQEKLKKERSQMRLGVFFQKPATTVQQDGSGAPIQGSARRKSLSLEPFDNVAEEIRRSQSPMKGGSSVSPTCGTCPILERPQVRK